MTTTKAKRKSKADIRTETLEKAVDLISQGKDMLESLHSELEEMRDNMEENFSGTARFESISEAVDILENSLDWDVDEVSGIDFYW